TCLTVVALASLTGPIGRSMSKAPLTYVPAPVRDCRRPSETSCSKASITVARAMPTSLARVRVAGRRWPARSEPARIRSRNAAQSWAAIVLDELRSIDMDCSEAPPTRLTTGRPSRPPELVWPNVENGSFQWAISSQICERLNGRLHEDHPHRDLQQPLHRLRARDRRGRQRGLGPGLALQRRYHLPNLPPPDRAVGAGRRRTGYRASDIDDSRARAQIPRLVSDARPHRPRHGTVGSARQARGQERMRAARRQAATFPGLCLQHETRRDHAEGRGRALPAAA